MIKNALQSLLLISLLPAATLAMAQGNDMKGMKGMDMPAQTSTAPKAAHLARGIVKAVHLKGSEVTISHAPIKMLNWPAMTMGFQVKDKLVLDKLTVGKTVDFEFVQAEQGYVVTKVK